MAHFSDLLVTREDGSTLLLGDLFEGSPFALVFLRHLGCVFCREQVKELADFPEWNVAFVSMAEPDEAARFKEKLKSPHVFLCDPEAALYERFRVGRGGLRQMFGGQNFRRGMEAMRKGAGVGAPVGDPWRLGATFVLDGSGAIRWEHRNMDASDNVLTRDIGSALERAGSGGVLEGKV